MEHLSNKTKPDNNILKQPSMTQDHLWCLLDFPYHAWSDLTTNWKNWKSLKKQACIHQTPVSPSSATIMTFNISTPGELGEPGWPRIGPPMMHVALWCLQQSKADQTSANSYNLTRSDLVCTSHFLERKANEFISKCGKHNANTWENLKKTHAMQSGSAQRTHVTLNKKTPRDIKQKD